MMRRQQVIRNAVLSVLQIVLYSIILFILYRYLLDTIGVQQLGIWSLVLATTTVTRLSNAGLPGSVVKFVAQYAARGDMTSVSYVVQTAAVSIAMSLGVVLLASMPVLRWSLAQVMPEPALVAAVSLLPYALISLWLTAISSIFQGALDGVQRVDLRNILLIGSSAVYLMLAVALVPKYGLLGLAYGQMAQSCLVLMASWGLLRHVLPVLPPVPYQWRRSLFSEMIYYGVNFQLIGLLSMLFDPVTKGLLSAFGNLALVGYYEMASRTVKQLRGLLIAANQVLVPVFADLHERSPEGVGHVYRASYRLLMYLALAFYAGVIAAIPLLSALWLGYLEATFMNFALLLAFGWAVNTLAGPAFFANQGIGLLRWNTVGYATIGGLNGGLGFVLGTFYGGIGVVLGWVAALAFGSALIVLTYHVKHHIPLRELLPEGYGWLLAASGTGVLVSGTVSYQLHELTNVMVLGMTGLSISVVVVFFAAWAHPMRGNLLRWVHESILNVNR